MPHLANRFVLVAACALFTAGLVHCGSSSSSTGGGSGTLACSSVSPDAATATDPDTCYPDNDGINNEAYTIAIAVNDTGFTSTGGDDAGVSTKNILATQNESQVTLTLTNTGTKPHGFTVGCVSVCSSYPTLPAGCSPEACFPAGATIAPIAAGATKTVTFDTPTPDGLIYPFSSSEASDSTVPGLNQGQWSLM